MTGFQGGFQSGFQGGSLLLDEEPEAGANGNLSSGLSGMWGVGQPSRRPPSPTLLVGSDALGYHDVSRYAELGTMTKVMPGGDGSLDWTLAGDGAWKYRNVLVPGSRVLLSIDGRLAWGGRYANDPLRHRLKASDTISCVASGLNAWAAKHQAFGYVAHENDYRQWFRVKRQYDAGGDDDFETAADQGAYSSDTEGRLFIKGDKDHTYDGHSYAYLAYWLFGGVDLGQDILGIDFEYLSNVPGDWRLRMRAGPDSPWEAKATGAVYLDDGVSRTSWHGFDYDFPAGTRSVVFSLYLDSSSSDKPATAPMFHIRQLSLICRGAPGSLSIYATVDEALVDMATRSGLATVTLVPASIGMGLTGIKVRPEWPKSIADGLRDVAGLHSAEIEHGFDLDPEGADRYFCWVKPANVDPTRNSVWLYGNRPGEDVRELSRDAEALPEYIIMPYRCSENTHVPAGRAAYAYYPGEPPSFASNVQPVTDYAESSMLEASAASLVERLWRRSNATAWQGTVPFGPMARDWLGRDRPTYDVCPGDRLSVPQIDGASDLYIAETSYDFRTDTASGTVGWPFDMPGQASGRWPVPGGDLK